MSDETESEVIVRTAFQAATPNSLTEGNHYSVIVPDGSHVERIDVDKTGDEDWPKRLRGTVALHDADSLTAFVTEHQWEATKVYANLAQFRFVAVINDAYKVDDNEPTPGWADHRAVLQLTKTPEWLHWENASGRMMSQGEFAEHIEDGLLEIQTPSAAEMLDLAQTFHANTGVAFKSQEILSTGQRQLHYEETTQVKAGQTGDITVPQEFTLGIIPFEGSDPWKIVARLRVRVSGGDLKIGYKLDRPHDVLRGAFDATVEEIDQAVAPSVLRGTPPEGVSS